MDPGKGHNLPCKPSRSGAGFAFDRRILLCLRQLEQDFIFTSRIQQRCKGLSRPAAIHQIERIVAKIHINSLHSNIDAQSEDIVAPDDKCANPTVRP